MQIFFLYTLLLWNIGTVFLSEDTDEFKGYLSNLREYEKFWLNSIEIKPSVSFIPTSKALYQNDIRLPNEVIINLLFDFMISLYQI